MRRRRRLKGFGTTRLRGSVYIYTYVYTEDVARAAICFLYLCTESLSCCSVRKEIPKVFSFNRCEITRLCCEVYGVCVTYTSCFFFSYSRTLSSQNGLIIYTYTCVLVCHRLKLPRVSDIFLELFAPQTKSDENIF